MNIPTFTVSQANRYIKSLFDSDLGMQSIFISGEISNFSNHYKTGHLYFSLKDDSASIKAVMFARQASKIRFTPENGMKVIVNGRISVFERDGVYQIYVENMQPDGAGALAVAFEQLKKRLEAEGLFSPEHKKPIPSFPKRVGVITSPTGAAVRDIFNVLGRRFPKAEVVFKGVSVQGASAPSEMIEAIEGFTRKNCADVIIIGRGGGSTEDLWCFNDELLARAVYNCPIPIISAVGHETDFTICDFVSDMRAPTPSAAAELAVPDMNTLMMNTASLTDRLYGAITNYIASEKRRLLMLLEKRSFTDPGKFFKSEYEMLNKNTVRLKAAADRILYKEKNSLTEAVSALQRLNPLSVLLRGYSLVSLDGRIVESVEKIKKDDILQISMSDGNVSCLVLDTERRTENE
ncbi:MAG: exodeoxyribonuclease VII large subunit [Clostridia bacterium]|nr:exodeoxyribonuclease VII large subunit [Clostridia bacterium]